MTLDNRTPAEIEYDRTALSTRDTQPTVRLTADGTPNKYDTGEWSWEKAAVRTPIATLADGATIVGTHDVDGSPHCVLLRSEAGHFYYGNDGVLAGEWAGVELELTPDQIETLRALFNSPLLPCLIDAAKAWCSPAV